MTAESAAAIFEDELQEGYGIATEGVALATEILRASVVDENENVQQAVASIIDLMGRGGKRARGVLAQESYKMYGGTDRNVMVTVAGVMELVHAYLLVLDDMADDAMTRRGGPAAHIYIRNHFLGKRMSKRHATKLGIDMATTTSLIAENVAFQMLNGLEGPEAGHKSTAIDILTKGLMRTGIGQLRDMEPKDYKNVNINEVLRTTRDKTAYYTFLLPIQVGAALAGVSPEDGGLDKFKRFAEYAGLGFQFTDDILGMYGDKQEIGKSPKSDLEEGKLTYMMARALEYASRRERRTLLRALGKASISDRRFVKVKRIIEETGALDQTGREAWDYLDRAKAELEILAKTHDERYILFFGELATSGVKRDS